jgi:hypothetical protein
MRRGVIGGAVLLACLAAAGCGENLTEPTAAQAPFAGQFSGTWAGAMVTTGVSGGECVGDDVRATLAAPGVDQGTITLTQTANDVSATVRSATTGLTCRFDGSASLTTFAASAVSCDAEILYRCSNGQPRILRPVGSTMTATQTGGAASGVVTTTYNVFSFDPATKQETPVAGLTVQNQFTALRR